MANPNDPGYGLEVVLYQVREEIERMKERMSRGSYGPADSYAHLHEDVGVIRALRQVESFIVDTYGILGLE